LVDLLARLSQLAYRPAECVYLIPVGEIDIRIQCCRTLGHPHDETDHSSVPESIHRIIDFAAENTNGSRLPGDLFEEFPDVRVGIRLFLLRLARHSIDREERTVLRLESLNTVLNELHHFRPVLAVTNTRADDYLMERTQINL